MLRTGKQYLEALNDGRVVWVGNEQVDNVATHPLTRDYAARTAEFFGLWGLAVKAASIFGPLTYGAVTWIFEGNHRLGILAVGVYFVAGLVLLIGIDIERGRRSALQAA